MAVRSKGDQMNEQAKRLSFLTGLGQTLIAKSHAPGKKTSLVLTAQYDDLLWKYADVLLRERISVYLIEPHGEVSERRLATLRPSFRTTRQGHPDGDFGCGRARYRVTNGHITEYRLDSRVQPSKASFTSLCRDLGIRIGTDSAARVLSRRSTRLSRSGAKTPNLPLQADEASPRR